MLSNAAKSTFQGEIGVSLRESEGRAERTVSDTGTGIAEDGSRTCSSVSTAHRRRTSSLNEGSGIGLALVHELVALHGGSIGVVSALGSGTTFNIRLPFGAGHLPSDQVRRKAREHDAGLQ